MTVVRKLALALVACGLLTASVAADDWQQWRGVDRLGIWQEDGIIESFPEEGLKVRWRTPLRSGYSGPAVADGRVFVLDWLEDPESRTLDGTERVVALDEETGAVLWTHEWQTTYRMLMVSYAKGPRATPTVDGDRVYVLRRHRTPLLPRRRERRGHLEQELRRGVRHQHPDLGHRERAARGRRQADRGRGGEPDALVVAFDKRTGEEIWRAVEVVGEMGYGQPVIYEAGGARQLIVWHAAALVSLDPETGEVYWEQEWEVGAGMSVATPVRSGDYLLVSQFYNGSMMMRLNQDRPAASMLWKGGARSEMPDQTDGLHALITTPLIIGDYIYGVGSYGELRAWMRGRDSDSG